MSFTKVTAAGIGTTSTVAFNFSGGLIISGVTTVSAGSTSAPTISPSGDTNTGIFFPSADTIAFAEGGTEVARIDSSGRFGIGTLTPSAVLHISSASPTVRISDTSGTASNLTGQILFQEMGTTSAMGRIGYTGGDAVLRVKTDGAQPIAFLTNDAERARIDSSGRLLVGTTSSPSNAQGSLSKLIVQGYVGADTEVGILSLQRGEVATSITANEAIGQLAFNSSDGGTFAHIQASADAAGGNNDYPGRLVFSTTADGASSPTERMRINNGGATGFFNAGDTVWSASSTSAGTVQAIYVGSHSGAGVYGGTVSYKVFTNGNVQNTNGSYTTLSDAKLKENIVDANSQWDDLKAIQIRSWNFKEETGHETHRQIGPIAQELETICPGLVFETADRDEDGNETGEVTKGVNQSVLYMKAVKALQEAMERIEQLETEMAEVKAQLS